MPQRHQPAAGRLSAEVLWEPGLPLSRQRQPQYTRGEWCHSRSPGPPQGLSQLRLRPLPPVHLHGTATPAQDYQPAGFPWGPTPGPLLPYVCKREQGHEGPSSYVSERRSYRLLHQAHFYSRNSEQKFYM